MAKNTKETASQAGERELTREELEKYLKEEVTIELFKDNERYKDDVFVAVNGKTYQIKRGVPVKVPRNVALVLERSRKQDLKTTEMIQEKSAEYKAKETHLT